MNIYDGTKEAEPNDIKINIGDTIHLKVSDITNSGFKNSEIGKLAIKHNVDILLEVGQKDWGELKFLLFFEKDGGILTNKEYESMIDQDSNHKAESDDDDKFYELGNYSFMRYLIKSGDVSVSRE